MIPPGSRARRDRNDSFLAPDQVLCLVLCDGRSLEIRLRTVDEALDVAAVLEDGQCAYLDEIHSHYPDISVEDLFLMIMVEGSAIDINRHMREFSREHGITHSFPYGA